MFFNLPHVFVVFPAGGSGNFLSQLIKKLMDDSTNLVSFSDTGNAHRGAVELLPNNETFACGIRYGVPNFSNIDDKINFYKEKIVEIYGNETNPTVGWTHDYSNIALYKKLYPNCKILVVTQWSDDEKLATLIQQELKNRLDPIGFVFVDDTLYKRIWEMKVFSVLKRWSELSDEVILDIIKNKDDPLYFPIVAFVTIKMSFEYYRSYGNTELDLLNFCIQHRCDIDKNFDPTVMYTTLFNIGPHYRDCITEDCVQVPYSTIMKNDIASLTVVLEKVLDKKFSETELSYIQDTVTSYFNKQNRELMSDPHKYFMDLEATCISNVVSLRTKT